MFETARTKNKAPMSKQHNKNVRQMLNARPSAYPFNGSVSNSNLAILLQAGGRLAYCKRIKQNHAAKIWKANWMACWCGPSLYSSLPFFLWLAITRSKQTPNTNNLWLGHVSTHYIFDKYFSLLTFNKTKMHWGKRQISVELSDFCFYYWGWFKLLVGMPWDFGGRY